MANEIQFTDATGNTNYVNLTNAVGQWYNTAGAAFEAYNASNFTDYDIAATEFGASGVYAATMPTVAAGTYNLIARKRAGGSPATTDTVVALGEIQWTGTLVLTAPLAADMFWRRTMANVEASAAGDTLNKSSGYGMVQQGQNSSVAGTVLTVNKTDNTALGTFTLTVSASADPITAVAP